MDNHKVSGECAEAGRSCLVLRKANTFVKPSKAYTRYVFVIFQEPDGRTAGVSTKCISLYRVGLQRLHC